MNIEEMKKSAINIVNINDSIEAPLLRIAVKVNEDTTIPLTNELIVYVDKSNEETNERKTYIFNLQEKLGINEAFVLEPIFDGNKVLLQCFVKRNDGTKEDINSEAIIMFKGENFISTNYINALISIVYPKNTDLVNYFLNTSIYGINNKNKILTLDDIFFKDCFIEVNGDINANFNELKVKCISSHSDGFRLDYAGNLRVKSLIVMDDLGESNIDFDLIYPVGSIYMSSLDINPRILFGGNWERIAKGIPLVGIDEEDKDFNIAKKIGGNKHLQEHTQNYDGWINWNQKDDTTGIIGIGTSTGTTSKYGVEDSGKLQPYFACYVWSRIS